MLRRGVGAENKSLRHHLRQDASPVPTYLLCVLRHDLLDLCGAESHDLAHGARSESALQSQGRGTREAMPCLSQNWKML